MKKQEQSFNRNLRRYRRWLNANAVASVIRGFLPTFLDDQSKSMNIIVNDGLESYTDGKTIVLSLIPPVFEDWYSEEDWMLCLKALAAHEAQHVNSSNFSDIAEIKEWYGKYLADNYSLEPTIGGTIAKDAQNIVEDGRIERIAVARRPGMFLPFQFMNQIIRNNLLLTERADNPKDEYRDFWNNLISYASTGLYSPGIQVYAGTRFESVFLGVQHLIDAGIASATSGECRQCVQELLEDVAPYMSDLIKSSPELEEMLTQKETRQEYTTNQGTADTTQSGGAGGNPLRVSSPTTSAAGMQESSQDGAGTPEQAGALSNSPPDSENESAGQNPDGSDSPENGGEGESGSSKSEQRSQQRSAAGFENAEPQAPPMSDSELNDLRNKLARDLANANREEQANQSPSSDALDAKSIEDIQAQYTGATRPIKQVSINITADEELPPEMKAQALMLRREITRVQDARSRSHKGLRRGTLDQGALWKTGLQDDRIFTRKSQPDAGSIAFYLLIDNSGSMADSADSESGKPLLKYQAARYAAAVIEEAVKGIVPCKIALFDQSNRLINHQIIKGFDEKKGRNSSWNSLRAIGPGGGNADSVNIRIASTELMRRPERKKVLLVLSDGEPSAYGSIAEGYTEVAEAVSSARRKGVIVIPIMFGDSNFLASSFKNYEMMYEKNIISCVPQEVVERLSSLFRQVIRR